MSKVEVKLNNVTISGELDNDKRMRFSLQVDDANTVLDGLSKRRLLEIKDAISVATMRGRGDSE